jgi:hypothetical protein
MLLVGNIGCTTLGPLVALVIHVRCSIQLPPVRPFSGYVHRDLGAAYSLRITLIVEGPIF